jgi:hypothetical protein
MNLRSNRTEIASIVATEFKKKLYSYRLPRSFRRIYVFDNGTNTRGFHFKKDSRYQRLRKRQRRIIVPGETTSGY